MKVVTVTLTEQGRALAGRLPWEHVHGGLRQAVTARWDDVDGFVLVASVGLAARVAAPQLTGKGTDPAVVCVDDAGRWAVPLLGGHGAGANDLARQVAALLGAEPVITTATDARGVLAFDQLPGLVAAGPVAAATRAVLDGATIELTNVRGWPLPPALVDAVTASERATAPVSAPADGATTAVPATAVPEATVPAATVPAAALPAVTVVVTDEAPPSGAGPFPEALFLHPASLVVGLGCSTDATAADAAEAVAAALHGAGLAPASVGTVATIDRRAGHPALDGARAAVIGRPSGAVPVATLPAGALASVEVPHPSAVVAAEVGTPSVAEAAALLVAGPGAELVVPKVRTARVTVAVARRARPAGVLRVVGLGPGAAAHRTPAATAAVRHAAVVVGFTDYVEQCADLLHPGQHVVRSPIGDEAGRVDAALAQAAAGHVVALVCSGDAGVYALATLAFERADHLGVDPDRIEVVPGVTAATTAAALLGAPLAHDHVAISLSDLLTPWPDIEARVAAAAASDLIVSLYNPRSQRRTWQLDKACALLGARRPGTTPVGVVTDAGRPGQQVTLTTLAELDPTIVGMRSIVVVGSSRTRRIGGRMVTPRGYVS